MTVWLEIGVALLLLLSVLQSLLCWQLWRRAQWLQQRVDALSHSALHTTDVPTALLVTALGRLQRYIGALEPPPTRASPSYELAQQLAREGADVEQLVVRCGLSREEASLILQLHAASAPSVGTSSR
jgi:hypothetical protein